MPCCPNTLWLEVHHIIFYADGGLTRPDNLITICSRCHKNAHEGRLIIQGNAPRGARFLNETGKDLREEWRLETAFWLDIWCGWRGTEQDRRHLRAQLSTA
ncbi:MAG: HNH endonuclease [Candidatus Eremiobacteraeota bacterium]|nr:HNH endonuclease [Candidatus Eremiobacteraeota bacterium]MCW5866612.1 HNH endonuclease [Candidatus Eremiobacteraeota bacterium]